MEKPTKITYIKLLAVCVAALVAIITLISFSDYKDIPSWSEMYENLFGGEETPTEEDYVKFIDVGQGDSILISSNGYNALVDFGNQSDYGSELLNSLESYGIKELDCIVVSHYDVDHVGGAAKVVEAIEVHYALLPEQNDRGDETFDDFQYALENNGTKVSMAKIGAVINIGDFQITVLAYNRDAENSNDRSIVLMAELDQKKFLLTGDAGAEIEQQLISDGINVDCDVFKAAHHGSRNSNCEEFVKAASPEYAIISAGRSNQYGHPHEEVLSVLEKCGAKIYRTDRSGDITFYIENGSISVETEY